MNNRLVAIFAAALVFAASTLPASATNTFNVQVTASTLASITVTTVGGASIVCNPGAAITGVIACTNTVNASGNIRSTASGTGSLTTTSAAISGTSTNTVAESAIKMTCADNGSSGTHGAGTFAAAAASSSSGVACASWAAPNVFSYNVNITFGIDAALVNADTYTLSSGWTVVAATT